jgi:hypothetical protein
LAQFFSAFPESHSNPSIVFSGSSGELATLGYPALTINGGLSSEGLPLGLQMVAGFGRDHELMRIGAWSQRVLGKLALPPL